MSNKPTEFLLTEFYDLERTFAAQLDRIKGYFIPTSHALGQRKPDLEHTEARLMGQSDYLNGVEDDA